VGNPACHQVRGTQFLAMKVGGTASMLGPRRRGLAGWQGWSVARSAKTG